MRIRVPETLAGITADWLEEALASRFPGVGIAHVEPVDVLHGACTKIRLAVRGDHPDLPPTMLMKAGFEPHSPAMRKMRVNEYHAYHDLVPPAGLNVPDCLLAATGRASCRESVCHHVSLSVVAASLNNETKHDEGKRMTDQM